MAIKTVFRLSDDNTGKVTARARRSRASDAIANGDPGDYPVLLQVYGEDLFLTRDEASHLALALKTIAEDYS